MRMLLFQLSQFLNFLLHRRSKQSRNKSNIYFRMKYSLESGIIDTKCEFPIALINRIIISFFVMFKELKLYNSGTN